MLRLSLICVFLIASTLATPISYNNSDTFHDLSSFQEERFNTNLEKAFGAGAASVGIYFEDDDDLVGSFLLDTKSDVLPNTDAAIRAKDCHSSPDSNNYETYLFSSQPIAQFIARKRSLFSTSTIANIRTLVEAFIFK